MLNSRDKKRPFRKNSIMDPAAQGAMQLGHIQIREEPAGKEQTAVTTPRMNVGRNNRIQKVNSNIHMYDGLADEPSRNINNKSSQLGSF